MVLTELVNDGNRPSVCWKMEDYDAFNVENALGYYHWAVTDPRVVAINIWPWSGWLPPSGCEYFLPSFLPYGTSQSVLKV